MSADRLPLLVLAGIALVAVTWWAFGIEPGWALYLPWAMSVVVFGLPHGAADHIVWASIRGPQLKLLGVLAGYVGIMAGYAVVWWVAPGIAVAIFIGMTIWHWGSADAVHSFKRAGAVLRSPMWFLASVCRGVLPMLAPLVFYPEVVLSVVAGWSPTIDSARLASMIPHAFWMLATIVILQAGWLLAMKRINAPMRLEVVETAILTFLLLAVHPLVSVGAYFTFWHAWHHDRRLTKWYRSDNHELWSRSKMQDQTIIMTITLVGLIGTLMVLPPSQSTFSFYLIAISVLTMPHIVVVWMMDGKEKWATG